MDSNQIAGAIDRQEWLTPVADGLSDAVDIAFKSGGVASRAVEDALHGTWLGHPLHPVLTDIPLGAWSVATTLDVMELATGRKDLAPGADAAVAIGLAGAVGAAVTGLTDWHDTDGKAKKVGIVHGMMNLTATGFYTASLVLRKRKHREAGIVCGLLGYAISSAAAWLGGNLVYEQKIGTDHAERESLPDSFVSTLPEEELHEGEPVRVEAGGRKVLLVRQGGRIYALADTCSHLGGPLAEGKLGDGTITCPWHGSTFRLEDGSIARGPATYPQPCFETRVRNGRIEVRYVNPEQRQIGATRDA